MIIRESVFGYITVLPGAFSAYRYIALQNDATGVGPLQKYFLGEKMVGNRSLDLLVVPLLTVSFTSTEPGPIYLRRTCTLPKTE